MTQNGLKRQYNKATEYHDKENSTKKYEISPILKRVLFHLFSWFIVGLIWTTYADKYFLSIQNRTSDPVAFTMLLVNFTYVGMLLLFPYRKFAGATRLGLATTFATLFTPVWPLAFAVGGLVAFIVHISKNRFYWGACSAIFIVTLLSIKDLNLSLLSNIPLWYAIFCIAILTIGCIPSTLRLIGKELTDAFWFGGEAKNEIARPTVENYITEQPTDEQKEEALLESYSDFEASLQKLGQLKEQLSPELISFIDNIQEKGYLIIQNMKEDPRDVLPGKRFLNRYLPITHSLIEQLIKAHASGFEESQLERIQQQSQKTLPNLSHAFTQTYQQLLQNDMDNLSADLNVLDKLLKSEGLSK